MHARHERSSGNRKNQVSAGRRCPFGHDHGRPHGLAGRLNSFLRYGEVRQRAYDLGAVDRREHTANHRHSHRSTELSRGVIDGRTNASFLQRQRPEDGVG